MELTKTLVLADPDIGNGAQVMPESAMVLHEHALHEHALP